MKRNLLMALMTGVMFWSGAAFAQTNIYSFNLTPNAPVPDADPNGRAFQSGNLSGMVGPVTNLSVTLNLSGGYNGDMYAYLTGPNGGFAVLLNRLGVSNNATAFGYSNPGLNVTFNDSAANSVQYYGNFSPVFNGGGQLTGTWQPDGVNIDPLSSPGSFLTGQTAMLGSFNGTDPNGEWTLFLADLSAGGQATVVSWTLDITTVPEPSSLALVAAGLALVVVVRRVKSSRAG